MGARRDPATDQPLPRPNDFSHVHDQVSMDLIRRKLLGTTKYGTPLQPHNGRNALQDAYEEALDLAVYLKQRLMEETR